ncbi:MAG: hypothetical protein ACW99Q_29090 [Candidatus Kariarchaeaceae archaeon]|jgi:hypothetical protein
MEKLPLGLPLDWHTDGTPIFQRGDFIRDPRPLAPNSGNIYDNIVLPEHRHLHPNTKFNMLILPPSKLDKLEEIWLGQSYPDKKRGFKFGRIIQALDITCRVILQRWHKQGYVTDFIFFTLQPFEYVIVPPVYESILLNASSDAPARFFEVQAKEEKRNIESIKELGGSGYLGYKEGKLLPNTNYDELPILRITPGLIEFKFMKRRSLYDTYVGLAKLFDFMDPPNEGFFIGGV